MKFPLLDHRTMNKNALKPGKRQLLADGWMQLIRTKFICIIVMHVVTVTRIKSNCILLRCNSTCQFTGGKEETGKPVEAF